MAPVKRKKKAARANLAKANEANLKKKLRRELERVENLRSSLFQNYFRGLVGTSNSDFNHSELLLAQSFCTGRIPFEFALNPEFRVFCQSLNFEFRVPTPQKIREILTVNTESFIKENESKLSRAKNYVIITDGLAESKNAPPTFFSVHVAFVDQYTFDRQVLLCGISLLDGSSETNNMPKIQNLVEKVGLRLENCSSMITDGSVADFKSIPCAGNAIAQLFTEFTTHVRYAGQLHREIKNVFKTIEESEGSLEIAMAYQKEYNVTTPLPSKSTNSKWGALFTDMQSYVVNSVYFPSLPCLAIQPNLILNYTKHMDVLKFVELLQPLYNVLDALTKEETFCSDVVPNLLCVKEELNQKDPNAVVLSVLIQKKIVAFLTNDQILLATISDPRYAYVPNLIDPRTWQEAEQILIEQDTEIQNPPSTSSDILEMPKTEDGGGGESGGLAGLLKRKINSYVGEKNLTSELFHYQALMATNRPCHTSNPLQFWKEQQHNLPKIAALSAQNLTAMASTAFAEKLYRKCAGILDLKDSRLQKRDMELYLMAQATAPRIDRELLDEEIPINFYPVPNFSDPAPFPDFKDTMDQFGPMEGTSTQPMEREVKEEPVEEPIAQPKPTPRMYPVAPPTWSYVHPHPFDPLAQLPRTSSQTPKNVVPIRKTPKILPKRTVHRVPPLNRNPNHQNPTDPIRAPPPLPPHRNSNHTPQNLQDPIRAPPALSPHRHVPNPNDPIPRPIFYKDHRL